MNLISDHRTHHYLFEVLSLKHQPEGEETITHVLGFSHNREDDSAPEEGPLGRKGCLFLALEHAFRALPLLHDHVGELLLAELLLGGEFRKHVLRKLGYALL